MASTKIPVELSSTPGIVDNSNATAITIDSSERVSIATAANGLLFPASHSKTKIGLYGATGTGAEFIGTSTNTLELSGTNINFNGASGSGTPNLKMGGTTIIDTSRNLINIGRITTADGINDAGTAGSSTIFNESGSTADFRIESDSNTHMFFLDGGLDRVGINTASPVGTLHAAGTTFTFDTPDGSGVTIIRTGNSAHLHLFPAYSSVPTIMGQGAGGLHLGYDSSTNGIRINTSNNVGIGTTSPAVTSKLHLYKASAGTPHYDTYATQIIEDTEARLQLMSNDGGNNAAGLLLSNEDKHWGITNHGTGSAHRFAIGYKDTSASNTDILDAQEDIFNITTGGNVGIGTTSIDEKLHVEAGNIKIEAGTVSTTRGLIIAHSGQTGNLTKLEQLAGGNPHGILHTTERALRISAGSGGGTGTSETLSFWTNASRAMTITTGQKVLVGGTTDRSRKFVVEGTGDLVQLYSTNTGAAGAQLDLTHDSSSAADGDKVGRVLFSTDDAQYASVEGIATSHSSRYGALKLGVRKNSSTYNYEALTIASDGSVNIGDGTYDTYLTLDKETTGTNGILFRNAGNNKGKILLNSDENLQFFVNNTTNPMTIVEAGGVVVGDTSLIGSRPTGSKLNIFGDGITLRLDGGSNSTKSILFRGTSSGNPGEVYADGGLRLRTEDSGMPISFHTNSTGSNNKRMEIGGSGDVVFYEKMRRSGFQVASDEEFMRVIHLSGPSSSAAFTRTVDVNSQFGYTSHGGFIYFSVHGWATDNAHGAIHFRNNGSGNDNGIDTVVLVDFSTQDGIAVTAAKGSGAYEIDITFTNAHSNNHGWRAIVYA
tara:strand:+ start:1850 stop:4330 length:2481 start_codon:yes stop_codon:yes gene_type:complete